MTHGKPKELEIEPDGKKCWFHYLDLSYDDFGLAKSLLLHWKIASIFESARHLALGTEVLKLIDVAKKQLTFFILGVHYEMNPELWTSASHYTVFPYKISVELGDLGQSSVTMYSELVNKVTNQMMGTCLTKIVLVDPTTRRPVPFPDWYMEKFGAARQKRPLVLSRAVLEVPVTAHCYSVKVAASDTDDNQHSNQGSYVRFCCDAAQSAVSAQALEGFHIDIARYPLIEQQVRYFGESKMEDNLQVFVWQPEPENQPGKIQFVIKRRQPEGQSPVIFQAYMTFKMTPLSWSPEAKL